MIIALFGIFFAVCVIMLVFAFRFSKKSFRIYLAAFNAALLLAYGIIWLVNYNDKLAEIEEEAEYVINKGDTFSDILYEGQMDGYECFRFSGMSLYELYVVPKDMVKISGFSKVYKPVKLYSRHNESFIAAGEQSTVMLSNGSRAFYSENIVKAKPDYSNLVFFSGVFGAIIIIIHNIACGIVVLVRKKK